MEAETNSSYAVKAQMLTLNGGILDIISKAYASAMGFDVPNLVYISGEIAVGEEGIVTQSGSNLSFSGEVPRITKSPSKIKDLTWNLGNDASSEEKAVEYTIYLKSITEGLSVENIAALADSLEVYCDTGFSGDQMVSDAAITLDENGKATIYVKTTRTVGNTTTTRYFKIKLIKEDSTP